MRGEMRREEKKRREEEKRREEKRREEKGLSVCIHCQWLWQHTGNIQTESSFCFCCTRHSLYHSSSQCAMPKRPKEEMGLYVNGILFGNRRRNSDSSDTEEVGVMVARNRDGTIDMSIVKEYVGKPRHESRRNISCGYAAAG